MQIKQGKRTANGKLQTISCNLRGRKEQTQRPS